MSTLTQAARVIRDAVAGQRDAIRLAAALPRVVDIDDCEITTFGDLSSHLDGAYSTPGDDAPVVILPGWRADDGQCEVEFPLADDGKEAAREYVEGGDWGDNGRSVDVRAWRVAYMIDADDDVVEVRVGGESHTIDIEPDHSSLIRGAVGRYGESCGDDPDDHDWTSEGEGGCDSNPGVWSTGGTTFVFRSHCRCCGLTRSVVDPGSQRNPGDGVTYRYEMADEDQIERWRASGAMDEDE